MGIFDFLKRKAPEAVVEAPVGDVQTLEVVPSDPQNFMYPVNREMRKGMWVVTPAGRVGILHKFLDYGRCEVHMTDAAGYTMHAEEHVLSSLQRALQSDIPANRREHLSRNELLALGYGE